MKKILLVDDEPKILQLLEKAFSKKGYQAFCASSGSEAIDIQRDKNIQVMFLDLNMPEMTGLELCSTIRKHNPMAFIYAMTGYASLFELSDCRDAGFTDYFIKPIDLSLFIAKTEDAFETLKRWKTRM